MSRAAGHVDHVRVGTGTGCQLDWALSSLADETWQHVQTRQEAADRAGSSYLDAAAHAEGCLDGVQDVLMKDISARPSRCCSSGLP